MSLYFLHALSCVRDQNREVLERYTREDRTDLVQHKQARDDSVRLRCETRGFGWHLGLTFAQLFWQLTASGVCYDVF